MKNLLVTIILMALFASCSKNTEKNEENKEVVEIDSFSIEIDVVDSLDPITESVVFRLKGESGEFAKKRLYVRNNTGSSLDLADLESFLSNDIEVERNRCSSTLAHRRACYIDLKVTYSESLGDSTVKVFPIINKSDEESNPFFNIVVEIDETYIAGLESLGDAIVKSESVINFGKLKKDEVAKKRFYFINTSEIKSLPVPTLSTPSNSNVTIVNNCASTINKLSSCYVDISYTFEGQVGSNVVLNEILTISSDNMSESSKSLALQGSSVEKIDPLAAKVTLTEVEFTDKLQVGKLIKRIYVSNSINDSVVFDGSNLIQSGATELKNTCKNLNLKKNSYCYIDLEITINDEDEIVEIEIESPEANLSVVVKNKDPDPVDPDPVDPVDPTPTGSIESLVSSVGRNFYYITEAGNVQNVALGEEIVFPSPAKRILGSDSGAGFDLAVLLENNNLYSLSSTAIPNKFTINNNFVENVDSTVLNSLGTFSFGQKLDGSLFASTNTGELNNGRDANGTGYTFPTELNWDKIIENRSLKTIAVAFKDDGLDQGTYKTGIGMMTTNTIEQYQGYYCPENDYSRIPFASAIDNVPSCLSSGVTEKTASGSNTISFLKNDGSLAFVSNNVYGNVTTQGDPRDINTGIDCNKDGTKGDISCIKSGVVDIKSTTDNNFIALKSDGSVHIWNGSTGSTNDYDYYGRIECLVGTGISCLSSGNDEIWAGGTRTFFTLNDGFLVSMTKMQGVTISDINNSFNENERIIDISSGGSSLYLKGDMGTLVYLDSFPNYLTVFKDVVKTYRNEGQKLSDMIIEDSLGNIKFLDQGGQGLGENGGLPSRVFDISNFVDGTIKNVIMGYNDALIEKTDNTYVAVGQNFHEPTLELKKEASSDNFYISYNLIMYKPIMIDGISSSAGKEIYLVKLDTNNSCSGGFVISGDLSNSNIKKEEIIDLSSLLGVPDYASGNYGLCAGENINSLNKLLAESTLSYIYTGNIRRLNLGSLGHVLFDSDHADISYTTAAPSAGSVALSVSTNNDVSALSGGESCITNAGIWFEKYDSCLDSYNKNIGLSIQSDEAYDWLLTRPSK